MAAAANGGIRLLAPDWQIEFGRLTTQVDGLPPGAQHAVASVVASVLAEGVLDEDNAEAARALLAALAHPCESSAPAPTELPAVVARAA
jgi:hypothetical protein